VLQSALMAIGLLQGRVCGFRLSGRALAAAPRSSVYVRKTRGRASSQMNAVDDSRFNRAVYTIKYRAGGARHGEAYFAEFYEVKGDGSAVTNKRQGAAAPQPGPFVPELSREEVQEQKRAQVSVEF
jgi:hypothetical protein